MATLSRIASTARNARRRVSNAIKNIASRAETFEGSAYGKRLERVAGELEQLKEKLYQNKDDKSYNVSALSQAEQIRAGSVMDETMQADILLRGTVGDRIYAASYDIWKDAAYDEREDLILEAFGVRDITELFEVIEKKLGGAIYGGDTQENYDRAVVALMEMLYA